MAKLIYKIDAKAQDSHYLKPIKLLLGTRHRTSYYTVSNWLKPKRKKFSISMVQNNMVLTSEVSTTGNSGGNNNIGILGENQIIIWVLKSINII